MSWIPRKQQDFGLRIFVGMPVRIRIAVPGGSGLTSNTRPRFPRCDRRLHNRKMVWATDI
jgi:hypothetical protein